MELCAPWDNTYLHNYKLDELEELPWIQSIYWWWQVKLKNRHLLHDLPQTFGGIKYVCQFWIRPTDNFLTHQRTSFRTNERWYNKYNTHKSTINKKGFNKELEGYFSSSKAINWCEKSEHSPSPSPLPYTNLMGKQICISCLNTDHRKFSNTYKDKFQDQWTLIQLIQTNKSTINNENMITKIQIKILDE